MSALTVLRAALDSDEAKRAPDSDGLARVVILALVDAGVLGETDLPHCESVFLQPENVLVRCEVDGRHSSHSAVGVSWTDDQAAGVLRERT